VKIRKKFRIFRGNHLDRAGVPGDPPVCRFYILAVENFYISRFLEKWAGGFHGPGLETGEPGIIFACLPSVQDSVLIDSPVTAFQANKVKKPGGWFWDFGTTRPLFNRQTKERPKARAGNEKKGVHATRGRVSKGTTDETRPRPPGSPRAKMDEQKFRNELRKSEKNFESPR
jgi:hypothetical protein